MNTVQQSDSFLARINERNAVAKIAERVIPGHASGVRLVIWRSIRLAAYSKLRHPIDCTTIAMNDLELLAFLGDVFLHPNDR